MTDTYMIKLDVRYELEVRADTVEEALEKAKKAYGKKSGGSVKMPDSYSKGNWKLI